MTGKIWGTAYPLYQDDKCRIVRVVIHKGWQCSIHRHNACDNTFQVVSGLLQVIEHPDTQYQRISVLHGDGETKTVRRGMLHCFRSLTDVVAIETYRASPGMICDENDIERLKDGFKFNVDA